jgi:hypothetical protein
MLILKEVICFGEVDQRQAQRTRQEQQPLVQGEPWQPGGSQTGWDLAHYVYTSSIGM